MPFGAVAGAVVAGGASLIGSSMSSSATKKAAEESAAVQREQMQMQRELADRSREDLMPYANAGRNALLMTTDLAGVNGADAARNAMAGFVESPGRQFALNEGLRGIERSAAAKGSLLSGNTLRAVTEFGQGLADQSFERYYAKIADIAKGGQAAAAGQQQAATTLGNQLGAGGAGIAQTIASAGGQQASIYGNAASNIGNAVNNGLSNYLYQQKTQPQQNALYDYAQPDLGGNAEQPRMVGGW